jgi:hypothetical protein
MRNPRRDIRENMVKIEELRFQWCYKPNPPFEWSRGEFRLHPAYLGEIFIVYNKSKEENRKQKKKKKREEVKSRNIAPRTFERKRSLQDGWR